MSHPVLLVFFYAFRAPLPALVLCAFTTPHHPKPCTLAPLSPLVVACVLMSLLAAGLLGIVATSMKGSEEGGLEAASDAFVAPAVAPKAVAPPPPPPPPPRKNAVLVLGSTGRIGRKVVKRVSVWVDRSKFDCACETKVNHTSTQTPKP